MLRMMSCLRVLVRTNNWATTTNLLWSLTWEMQRAEAQAVTWTFMTTRPRKVPWTRNLYHDLEVSMSWQLTLHKVLHIQSQRSPSSKSRSWPVNQFISKTEPELKIAVHFLNAAGASALQHQPYERFQQYQCYSQIKLDYASANFLINF